ncbi:hypothetical protein, partial [Neobacillus cucumis]|uniref:hypothetical protein n=1 Tax=Neobacillus cucumis TaxID=1740721 RepID=UPI002E1B1D23|nr:hypothetical protein [Neobacillus cucumis]
LLAKYIVLNAYIVDTAYGKDPDFNELSNVTGKSESEIKRILISLYERGKIEFNGNEVNKNKLATELNRILQEHRTISDRIAESRRDHYAMGGYGGMYGYHMGIVELVPYDEGVSVTHLMNMEIRILCKKNQI